jgi:hypothetical protein
MISMHLLHNIAIRPNVELETRPKQHLGYLPLVIALPVSTIFDKNRIEIYFFSEDILTCSLTCLMTFLSSLY